MFPNRGFAISIRPLMKHRILPLLVCSFLQSAMAAERPNVLFIAIDDLNHWITHLERNPQARTPNIDRLAKMGTTFRNAHCAVPACEPSRCAIMGGRRPWTTGCYKNGHKWQQYQPAGEGLSAQFLKAGYRVYGAGKIYHSMQYHPSEWTDYMSRNGLSSNGPGVQKNDGYHNNKTHPQLKDDDLIDWHTTDYCIRRLREESDQPFFIACGLYKPHLPFVAPRKYYDAFPLESIKLPPHIENDLDDVPPAGVKMAGPQGDHAKFLKSGRWKAAIQSYLATCAYTDMNVGRLLDALDKSPHKDNTIIVLWGDHGWHLGEKEHWRKHALWDVSTRTPLIISVPDSGTKGQLCHRPVSLIDLYPTLVDLCGLPERDGLDGQSFRPLLKNPSQQWDRPVVMTYGPGNHAVQIQRWRYIRYTNGGEELYDHTNDPNEWINLAGSSEHLDLVSKMQSSLPMINRR